MLAAESAKGITGQAINVDGGADDLNNTLFRRKTIKMNYSSLCSKNNDGIATARLTIPKNSTR